MITRFVGCLFLPLMCAGLVSLACNSGPQGSETKTNWLSACDVQSECEGVSACVCGLCTIACDTDEDCGKGICGSVSATRNQCGGIGGAGGAPSIPSDRICVPETSECSGGAKLADDSIASLDLAVPVSVDCPFPQALFCEDFEGALGGQYSGVGSLESQPTYVSSCQVNSGSGALRVDAKAEGSSRQIFARLPESVSSGDIYLRLFMYLDGDAPIGGFLVTAALWTATRGADKISIDLDEEDELAVVSQHGVPQRFAAPASLTRKDWACIELKVTVDDAAGAIVLSVDDVEVLNETGLDTKADDPIESVVIASAVQRGSEGVRYYVDDLVVARAPVGCDLL